YGVTNLGRSYCGAYRGKGRVRSVNVCRLHNARNGQKQCSEKGGEPARPRATWLEKGRIISPRPKWRIGIGKPMASGPTSSATTRVSKSARTARGQWKT